MNLKQNSITISVSIMLGLLLTALAAVNADAACSSIPSGSYPKTLAANNTYCLTASVTVSGTNAFIIGGDNITFDLAGYEIRNTIPGTGIGISGASGKKNIIIKNGKLNGFGKSIDLGGISGLPSLVINVLIDGITSVNTSGISMNVYGQGGIIRNCQIYGTPSSHGIIAGGTSFSILNNDLFNTAGIYMDFTSPSGIGNVIENNRIGNPALTAGTTGITVGVDVVSALVVNNRVRNMETGIRFEGAATGKIRDNITLDCTTSYDTPVSQVENLGNNY